MSAVTKFARCHCRLYYPGRHRRRCQEYPVGAPKHLAGLEVAAGYPQAVDMAPVGHCQVSFDGAIAVAQDSTAVTIKVAALHAKVSL